MSAGAERRTTAERVEGPIISVPARTVETPRRSSVNLFKGHTTRGCGGGRSLNLGDPRDPLSAVLDPRGGRRPRGGPARPPRPGARPGARLGGRRLDDAALAAYLTNAKQGRQRSFWGFMDSSTFTGNTLSPSDRAMRYRLMYCHSASIWMVSQYFGV